VTDQKFSATEIARLREELAACHELLAEQRRQMTVLEFATQALTFSLDPEQVVQTATSLAATLASPPGSSARRGVYYEISADTMRIIADSDDTGASAVGTWMPISEHPLIPRALAAGKALAGTLDPEHAGPRARQIIARFSLKFAAYVPVRINAGVHGVLVVSSRDKPITGELVERLEGLGASRPPKRRPGELWREWLNRPLRDHAEVDQEVTPCPKCGEDLNFSHSVAGLRWRFLSRVDAGAWERRK